MSDGRNRLARESSPYLLLHADNPVDWYAWGDEAFAKARAEDKPVFLSVGYSTCYWCHVMEREVFSNPEMARLMNDTVVAVKLDREERPDLDEIYMTATQLLTRSGGWPNSVFLTPEGKPFFAGTYFPPEDRYGRPGFPRILAAIREAWGERRGDVLGQAEAVAEAIRAQLGSAAAGEGLPRGDIIEEARSGLARRFDREWGGFGGAPKFPSPSNLFFLLDLSGNGDEGAREMLAITLERMARGGIHDQLAGGFHRYSTDAEWLVPHFEKMLYDNAALATLYAEAASSAPDAGFDRVARSTLDFVLAELTSPDGAFLSAIDAETDGHEGAYYTWTREELGAVLAHEQDALLATVYGFDGKPNFEGERYVLHLARPLAEAAKSHGTSVPELLARIAPMRKALLDERWKRKRPLVDDKILTDWNGLMIAAMARAGVLLDEPRYTQAAARASEFLLTHVLDEAGMLLHSFRGGTAKIPALLDDYAFLVRGLIRLHEALGETRWLHEAQRLVAEQDRELWDEGPGGYFAASETPELLVRPKSAGDGAMASGNGIAVLNLLDLSRLTGEGHWRERAAAVLTAFAKAIEESPLAHVTLLRALRLMVPHAQRDAAANRSAFADLAEEALGVVEAQARLEPGGTASRPFVVEIKVQEGWHLNANPARPPTLIPTVVQALQGSVRMLRYPPGDPLRAAFAPEPVSVYRGTVRIEGELDARNGTAALLTLTYQACDETRCLPPVTKEVPLR